MVSGSRPPLVAVLSTVQSPYWFTVGHPVVLSLGGWAPRLHAEFHGLRATQDTARPRSLRLRDCHPLRFRFPSDSARSQGPKRGPTTPGPKPRFGLVRFRSPLLTESRLISFPPGTEMFQFPGFASDGYAFTAGCVRSPARGFPHSDTLGSRPGWRLPEAFAASRVLHRLRMPRRPPRTLHSLATPVPPSPGPFPDRLPASPRSGRRCGSFVPLTFFPRRCSARPGPLRPGLPPKASRPGPHPKSRPHPVSHSVLRLFPPRGSRPSTLPLRPPTPGPRPFPAPPVAFRRIRNAPTEPRTSGSRRFRFGI